MSITLTPDARIQVRRPTDDGYIWNTAKVVDLDENKVLVEFPGGHREIVTLDGEDRIREVPDGQ